ncbi:MAG: hypothetical protein ACXWBN_00735 [Acidimicrobiales bacterium]
MDHTPDKALVRTILEHATDYPWRLQGIGLLALRLDDRREYRLHVWDPDGRTGDPPIHDHPYDFTSTVVVGELINTRYIEDPTGDEYRRQRYSPSDENDRRTDTVRLAGTSTTLGSGDHYHQLAGELHDSHQVPGTVTVIRCSWRNRPELTVCLRPGAAWVSGLARPATPAEIERITAAARDLFDADQSPE